MANIPNDVMHFCILPRLPVKSLIRFKCVSKSWQTLINSPDFIRGHHRHALSSDRNRLLMVSSTTVSQRFELHDLDSPSTPSLLLPYPKPVTCTTPMRVRIVASCEFFLLLCCSLRHPVSIERVLVDDAELKMDRECSDLPKISNIRYDEVSGKTYGTIIHHETEFYGLFLLNPATGIYYKIPNSSKPISFWDSSVYGLYLDEANDEYKIFRIIQGNYDPPTDIDVMVYSNKTNLWKSIEKKFDTPRCRSPIAVVGHLFHMIVCSIECEEEIGCLDIVAERWKDDVPFPDQIYDCGLYCDELCVFDGMLCVSMFDFLFGEYEVWVLKEYGVKESWVRLMNIVPKECVPITYRTGSRHELLCRRDGSLCWYNIRNKETKQVEIDGCSSVRGHVCKGSLVRFSGGQQINIDRA